MFGNAPKALWQRWITPDEQNRIPLACRAMLVEDDGRWILFETGIGAFFEPKLRDRFGVVEDRHVLLDNLAQAGLSPAEIDVVVLSHLHFDHAGGLLSAFVEGQAPRLLFDKATFVVSEAAWQRALTPHSRDKASFIDSLHPQLESSGRLEVVALGEPSKSLGPQYKLHYSNGHTPGLMLAEVPSDDGPIVFAGDLVPGRPWVHLPITMGYDRYPEMLIDEKRTLLEDLVSRNGRLFFTHDAQVAMSAIGRDEHGRFAPTESWATLDGISI